jgi:hypothetical protein
MGPLTFSRPRHTGYRPITRHRITQHKSRGAGFEPTIPVIEGCTRHCESFVRNLSEITVAPSRKKNACTTDLIVLLTCAKRGPSVADCKLHPAARESDYSPTPTAKGTGINDVTL